MMMTTLNAGFGDGIPPNPPTATVRPMLALLGVGSLLPMLLFLAG